MSDPVVDELAARLGAERERLLAERGKLAARVAEIDLDLVRLGMPAPEIAEAGRPGAPVNTRDVIHAVASCYRVRSTDLTSSDRHKSLALARHVAMYLARRLTKQSYPELGREFGMRDHTTVISAVDKVEGLLAGDPEFRRLVLAIEAALLGRESNAGGPRPTGER